MLHVLVKYCDAMAPFMMFLYRKLVIGLRHHRLSKKLQLDPKLALETATSMVIQNEIVNKQQPRVREINSETVPVISL